MGNAIEFAVGFDLNPLKSGGRQAEASVARTMGRISSSARQTAVGMQSLIGLIAGGSIVAGIKHVVNYASELNDLSESIGLSTDQFQRFGFAIEQSGGTQAAFQKGMGAIIAKMEDAKKGNEGAIATFARLGITWSDLHTLSPDQILLRVADALKAGEGNGRVTADVMELLGTKVALKLIPALKGGSAAFLELGNSANIASAEAIKAADDLGDRWDKLKRNIGTGALNRLFSGADEAAAEKQRLASRGDLTGGMSGLSGLTNAIDVASAFMAGIFVPRNKPAASSAAEAAGSGIVPAQPATKAEAAAQKAADDEANEAQKEALQNFKIEEQTRQRINDLSERTAEIYLEINRAAMDSGALIADLEAERAQMTGAALSFEQDLGAAAGLVAAQLREQIALLDQRIAREKERVPFKPVARDTGEDFGPSMRDFNVGRFGKLATFQNFTGAGGLTSSGLRAGGLAASGLTGGAQGLVRRGDAGRRRQETEKMEAEKKKSDDERKAEKMKSVEGTNALLSDSNKYLAVVAKALS